MTDARLRPCNKCSRELPLTSFHRRSARPDGLDLRCKECLSAIGKTWSRKKHAPDPVKLAANVAARNAIKSGLLMPEPCFICGAKAEAHHPAYSSPLLVTWLCKTHHRQIHAEHAAAQRKVLAVNLATGEQVVIDGVYAWADRGFMPKNISAVFSGRRKSYRGWHFSRINQQESPNGQPNT